MFSDKGFILTDALICCVILSIIAFITLSVIQEHASIQNSIHSEKEQMEIQCEENYRKLLENAESAP